jgi:hypothetical protein
MNHFKYPFRVGRKQLRAILDAEGRQVVLFDKGLEQLAVEYCELVNEKHKYFEMAAKFKKSVTDFYDKQFKEFEAHMVFDTILPCGSFECAKPHEKVYRGCDVCELKGQ